MECLLVTKDSVSECEREMKDIREHLGSEEVAVIYFSLLSEELNEEETGAIMFRPHSEDEDYPEDFEYNDNINRWLRVVANQWFPLIRGDAFVFGMAYNGEAHSTDVGEVVKETFKELE